MSRSPFIIHVPHSSTFIPEDIRTEIVLSDDELESELLKMTDWYTDELVESGNEYGAIIKYKYSRLVVDPERFRDDENEMMAKVGMGAVYTLSSDLKPLRKNSAVKKENLLRRYYDPYHHSFNETTKRVLDASSRCLILDIHSFPSRPLPYELNQNPDRPDICLGTSDYHSPESLIEFVEKYFSEEDLKTSRNTPFAGTFVPINYYRKDRRVSSLMIEINRSLYMDEETGQKLESFSKIQNVISQLIVGTVQFLD